MPYRIYEVIVATTLEVETADEHGGTSTHHVDKIVVKIPKAEMRFGWSQLYAILSLLFVPALIDALWIYFSGPLRSMETPPRPTAKSLTKEDKKPYWKKKKDDFKKEFCQDGPICFLISLPCLACGLATAIAGGPVFALMIVAVRAVKIIFGFLVSIVDNLVAALMSKQTFVRDNNSLRIVKATEEGEEIWEARFFIIHDDSDMLVPTAPFARGSFKRGDQIRVGFGPFETLCFFGSYTQRTAQGDRPVDPEAAVARTAALEPATAKALLTLGLTAMPQDRAALSEAVRARLRASECEDITTAQSEIIDARKCLQNALARAAHGV